MERESESEMANGSGEGIGVVAPKFFNLNDVLGVSDSTDDDHIERRPVLTDLILAKGVQVYKVTL